MKILLTGAQGTGKSTILKELEKEGFKTITEVVRNLAKTGVNVNEMGDEEGQNIIFKTYQKLLNENDDYVSDRCLIDVAAYTRYSVGKGKIHPSLLWEQLEDVEDFVLDCFDGEEADFIMGNQPRVRLGGFFGRVKKRIDFCSRL